MSQFRVKVAFDRYSVGAIIEPTGLYRGELLRMGYIERITVPQVVTPKIMLDEPQQFTPSPKKKPRKQNADHAA